MHLKRIADYSREDLVELLTDAALNIMTLQSQRDKAIDEANHWRKFVKAIDQNLDARPIMRNFYTRPKQNPRS